MHKLLVTVTLALYLTFGLIACNKPPAQNAGSEANQPARTVIYCNRS